jgi:hypothetical protein
VALFFRRGSHSTIQPRPSVLANTVIANNSSFTGTILLGKIRIVRRTIVSKVAGIRRE